MSNQNTNVHLIEQQHARQAKAKANTEIVSYAESIFDQFGLFIHFFRNELVLQKK